MVRQLQPCRGRIIVERIEGRNETQGGLLIPDTAKEKPVEGRVIAVGEASLDANGHPIPVEVCPGDTILFGKWAGQEVKIDGTDYVILKTEDVMGRFKNA